VPRDAARRCAAPRDAAQRRATLRRSARRSAALRGAAQRTAVQRCAQCECCLTLLHPTQAVEVFGNISTAFVHWSSVDIHRKFYGDRPRGTPPPGELNTRGVAKHSDFGPIEGYISETVQDRTGKLVLMTNRKSHMSFRLLPKSVTLNDCL